MADKPEFVDMISEATRQARRRYKPPRVAGTFFRLPELEPAGTSAMSR